MDFLGSPYYALAKMKTTKFNLEKGTKVKAFISATSQVVTGKIVKRVENRGLVYYKLVNEWNKHRFDVYATEIFCH